MRLKKSLRSFYTNKILDLNLEAKSLKEQALVSKLKSLTFWHQFSQIAAYQALKDEANIENFYQFYFQQIKKPIAFPKVSGTSLDFYNSEPSNDEPSKKPSHSEPTKKPSHQGFQKGSFSVLEPSFLETRIELQNLEAILVPGRAFDSKGQRLGRGKAYYDRVLSKLPCFKIGICFSDQIHNEGLPLEEHDICMDMIVTESVVLIPTNKISKFQNFYKRTV